MRSNKIFVFIVMLILITTSSEYLVLGYGGPPEQTSANNYTVKINTNHESYDLGETMTFSGNVNKYDENRNLRISIFDSNKNLIVTQKTLVDTDGTFSHSLILDEYFLYGKYTVKAQYGNSKATVESITFLINSNDAPSIEETSNQKIPDWIKSNAGWWANGQIDDNSFVEGIQFLIKEGLMKIPVTKQGMISQDNNIPDWIKSNAGWWANGQIDDNSFVEGIQFLIKEGLMKI